MIAEARRTFTYLNMFGYRVDAIVVNRVLPDELNDPYFERWKELQQEHLRMIDESFSPIPILRSTLRRQEVVGTDALLGLGSEVYKGSDPAEVLYVDDPMSIAKRDGAYLLSLRLPFVTRDDLELSARAGELFVRIGSYRRTILLPKLLATREISSAKLVGDRVEVIFQKGNAI